MGCDFQISGSQPDPEIRNSCLTFLQEFNAAIPAISALEYTGLKNAAAKPEKKNGKGLPINVFGDPIYAKTPLERVDHYPVFGKPDEFSSKYRSCTSPAVWSMDAFTGNFAYGVPIVFDNAAGGTLCSLHREPSFNTNGELVYDWNFPEWLVAAEERGVCTRILLYPACHIRFGTGNPFYYTMAEVLKKRFIPDLYVWADYDVDWYASVLKRIGFSLLFAKAPEKELPVLAVEAALQTGMIYYWNSETKERIFDENEKKLKVMETKGDPDEKQRKLRQLLKMKVEELEISVALEKHFKNANIQTLADLVRIEEAEMLGKIDFDTNLLAEVKYIFENLELSFGMDLDKIFNTGKS
jgi:hypothetical protein